MIVTGSDPWHMIPSVAIHVFVLVSWVFQIVFPMDFYKYDWFLPRVICLWAFPGFLGSQCTEDSGPFREVSLEGGVV